MRAGVRRVNVELLIAWSPMRRSCVATIEESASRVCLILFTSFKLLWLICSSLAGVFETVPSANPSPCDAVLEEFASLFFPLRPRGSGEVLAKLDQIGHILPHTDHFLLFRTEDETLAGYDTGNSSVRTLEDSSDTSSRSHHTQRHGPDKFLEIEIKSPTRKVQTHYAYCQEYWGPLAYKWIKIGKEKGKERGGKDVFPSSS